MHRLLPALLLILLPLTHADAADGKTGLPRACVAAAQVAPPMDDMAGMAHGGDGASAMHHDMAQAATIEDPDLSFNCGMIAHHQGAIAMAEAELQSGKDVTSRRLAEAIIVAQKREIAEMTAWVEQHAR